MDPTGMQYRELGRTGLQVSAVGFGTSQLRRVTATQAIDTLLTGFDLGVNIVHTAPDYEGALDLVAAAVARTPRKVLVACNAYDVHGNRTGRVRLFEKLFEATCRKLHTDRLELFGIASVEDRETFRENVWGRHGMVEYLQRMKAQGRLGSTFCTCHGKPEFTAKLIESGAFDAVMLAYNPLGFHSLTLNPPPGGQFENIPRTQGELFPVCRKLHVGIIVMMPLAGGLLCRGKAFPPAQDVEDVQPGVAAADVLRTILSDKDIACVLPGTASPEEAEENARAGHGLADLPSKPRDAVAEQVKALRSTLCSRCGECEPLCSQKLPISWMFRAGHMATYPSSPYETWEEIEYFRIHPSLEATCATCPDVTCVCPSGIDIPRALITLNGKMTRRMKEGRVAPPLGQRDGPIGNRWFGARVVTREIVGEMVAGETYLCRLFVENTGVRRWHPDGVLHRSVVRLGVNLNDTQIAIVDLREKVIQGRRCHFVFQVTAPAEAGEANLTLQLFRDHPLVRDRNRLKLFSGAIPVRDRP